MSAVAPQSIYQRSTRAVPACVALKRIALLVVGSVILSGVAHAGKAAVDMSGLEEDTRALVAKERARAMTTQSDGEKKLKSADKATNGNAGKDEKAQPANGSALLDSRRPTVVKGGVTGGCDMNIGNTDSKPGSASAKPKPVIITGPVVQLCNK
jgi:hypothetical protein